MTDAGLRRYVALVMIEYGEELEKRDDQIAELKKELNKYRCHRCHTPASCFQCKICKNGSCHRHTCHFDRGPVCVDCSGVRPYENTNNKTKQCDRCGNESFFRENKKICINCEIDNK